MIEYYILVAGPTKEYIQTDSLSAEICKYMENTYFATKIIFCNEFYNLCKHFNTEYTKVRELWLKDNRINKLHTLIYNQDKPFCFGGKCLPKDLSGIIMCAKEHGYEANFLQNVQDANTTLRKPNPPNIFMIHRVLYDYNQAILPLYFDRKMVIGYEKLKDIIIRNLKNGLKFGSLQQCLENPNQYFCLSFDDGFKEHLWVARQLMKDFSTQGIQKESLIFAINAGNTLLQLHSGMDIIYALAKDKLQEMFEFLDSINKKQISKDVESSLLSDIEILKRLYNQTSSATLQKFSVHFAPFVNLYDVFLCKEELKELSNIATIASHSMIHRDLCFHIQDSECEIQDSKAYLENVVQQEINIFCYPEGKNDTNLQEFCQKSGYTYALSVCHSKDNNFCIGRRNIQDYE